MLQSAERVVENPAQALGAPAFLLSRHPWPRPGPQTFPERARGTPAGSRRVT